MYFHSFKRPGRLRVPHVAKRRSSSAGRHASGERAPASAAMASGCVRSGSIAARALPRPRCTLKGMQGAPAVVCAPLFRDITNRTRCEIVIVRAGRTAVSRKLLKLNAF